ncbi:5-oxoprolinase/urea amidolyase family protein [Agrobacterium rhizogenes]|uniref:5-oxoprolinase subunit B/C family protein n=1 Tax=Rhizobium rhizogenes TaxID=359 RepID=UPI00080F93F4|nr:5-oxoprolinase/urea amidolyase family protein [Rhizobium rhizogenes]OCJ04829.1 allophanate hydrolase [Agrobacterium sp. 13-626]OCJ29007.1 allophanate hydrolase [Agrobacterium sp. B133/95]NTG44165.1 5-oxoprolinase/urea amidolyase family protein [Rhizobium rhizogenes]NTH15380.1 5-oxoprolinase/urea amidolyase family protein [Rhizobium rhizogenes]NTH21718.1 5-oxoprolinase/urea amidolyase family protein [Rhizobium rhizogenes]
MRFLPVSLTVILVELADLDETLALFASLEAEPVDGIIDMVPAARTLMIRFRPEKLTAEALTANIATRDLSARIAPSDVLVEIPVQYDGEDLSDVAELTGLSVEEVVRRHTESTFTVAFCGFAPGFGYLVGGDIALQVPRRQSPRTKIPAGSVALAGAFSGVYPQASPGGWQIIGTTTTKMWDLSRDPPALFQPGYRVRFFDLAKKSVAVSTTLAKAATSASAQAETDTLTLKVLLAPMPALFQDLGRFGQTGQGVSSSGALDQGALKAANRLVGNPAGTACLEIILGGFSFEVSGRAVFGVTGAPCPISIRDASGRMFAAETYQPVSLEAGDVVTLGQAPKGMRSYLSVRGGFRVKPVLGSASTDTLAVVGPDPVTAGMVLTINSEASDLNSVSLIEAPTFAHPAPGEVVTLDVIMGPRSDWFTEAGIAALSNQLFHVTPQSNRVGIRLSGETALERKNKAELPSEGTATGAIQVPHSGQPVLFLADHPLTGGYPVIGTVAEHHLDLAGQIPVNAQIRFRPVRDFADIKPAKG